jgi:hypothetical protein
MACAEAGCLAKPGQNSHIDTLPFEFIPEQLEFDNRSMQRQRELEDRLKHEKKCTSDHSVMSNKWRINVR